MPTILLCPGQGAQSVGMGRGWYESSPAARAVFDEADALLGDRLGGRLSALCFDGPARAPQPDRRQPARALRVRSRLRRALADLGPIAGFAGLSLGEYTALHLAGVFSFAEGLRLVTERGRLMQDAAVASQGSMVALIGADDTQAEAVAQRAAEGDILVCANYNAPGQVVLSGMVAACDRAVAVAGEMGFRATRLAVAGAFHSPLMQPAADGMGAILDSVRFAEPSGDVWSNVTARPHERSRPELLRQRLVEQIVSPVRWAQSCADLAEPEPGLPAVTCHELAPGTVLKGLFRRINRTTEVISHDKP